MKNIGSYSEALYLFNRSLKLSAKWPVEYLQKKSLFHLGIPISQVQAFSQFYFFSAYLEKKLLEKERGVSYYLSGLWDRYPLLTGYRESQNGLKVYAKIIQLIKILIGPKLWFGRIDRTDVLVLSSGRHLDEILGTIFALKKEHKITIVGKISAAAKVSLKINNIAYVELAEPKLYLGRLKRFKYFFSFISSRKKPHRELLKNGVWRQRLWFFYVFELPEILATIEVAWKILGHAKPKLLLVSSSNDTYGAAFSLISKKLKIPVGEIQHGYRTIDHPSSFYRADYQLAWGKMVGKINKGNKVNYLAIGCIQYDENDFAVGRRFTGHEKSDTINVLVLLSPAFGITGLFKTSLNKDMINDLIVGLKLLPKNYEITLRCHPSYSIDYDISDIDLPSNMSLSNKGSVEKAVAQSHVILTQPTTAGFIAACYKKPLLFFNNSWLTIKHPDPLVSSGSAKEIPERDFGKINSYITNLLGSEKTLKKQRGCQEKFMREYCASFGKDAQNRLCRFVNEAIKKRINEKI